MTARLTLVCHAATAATRGPRFPRPDDAVAAGGAMPAVGPGRAVAAPERRARETAAALGRDAAVDGALCDLDVGRWAGLSLADLADGEPEGLAAWATDPSAAPHGGESVADLVARVEVWMAARAAEGGRWLAVTHPAVVRAAVVLALGAGPPGFWRVEAPPLCRAALSHDGRRWTLAALLPP